MSRLRMAGLAIVLAATLSACLGTVVGTAADVTIEVAKVPFKVAGAAVDVASGDDDDSDEKKD
ncbi:MAG: NF038104 family lipoprotein [Pseudohongiellaceae bacterium]